VLDHFAEHPGSDRVVDRVDRGRTDAHNEPTSPGRRIGQVVAHGRSGVEGTEGDGSHLRL
jgi:hypothetical protein